MSDNNARQLSGKRPR